MKVAVLSIVTLTILLGLPQAQEPVLWVFGWRLTEWEWQHVDEQVLVGVEGASYLVYAPPAPKPEAPPPSTSPVNFEEWNALLFYQMKHIEPAEGETYAQARRRVGVTLLNAAKAEGFILDWRWDGAMEVKLKSLVSEREYWQLQVFSEFEEVPPPTKDELCKAFIDRVNESLSKPGEVFLFFKREGVMPEICRMIPCVENEMRAELNALLSGRADPDSLFWFRGSRGAQMLNPLLP